MKSSIIVSAPAISLLSPSPAVSRKAQSVLASACGMINMQCEETESDKLDQGFQSSIPWMSQRWISSASQCPTSGAIIHFLSPESVSQTHQRKRSFNLLGITDAPRGASGVDSIKNFRTLLASHASQNATVINLKLALGRVVSPVDLLRPLTNAGLPVLSLPERAVKNHGKTKPNNLNFRGLKEVTIPYFDHAMYADGTTVLSKLANAHLERPAIGTYRWPDSDTILRPIPSASEDQRVPAPSLIFQSSETHKEALDIGVKMAKIGFGGQGSGQIMLIHEDIRGLDIRRCPKNDVTSMFFEAQDSLLAGSLDELQSPNALLAGGEKMKHDERTGTADCWVEVRANIKRPSGFWKASKKNAQKIVKPPDLPYE